MPADLLMLLCCVVVCCFAGADLVVGGVVVIFEICVGCLFRWLRLVVSAWCGSCLVVLLSFVLVLIACVRLRWGLVFVAG